MLNKNNVIHLPDRGNVKEKNNKKFLPLMKGKFLVSILMLSVFTVCSADANLSLIDLTAPKAPAYRVGISEIPENRYIEASQDKENVLEKAIEKHIKTTQSDSNDVNYAELSIKRLSKEISQDLEYEEQDMVSDLSLLWQGAATQSDTINFALYKLANPDADKPDKSTIKNMLKTIASMSTLAGVGSGNPILAGASLIGGNVFGIMSQDTKALNYKYSKVTDADMIILIRKVEDLQQQTVNLYYDYMNAKKQLELASKLAQERRERFELAQKNNVAREILVITDSYYRTAVDRQKSARSEFLAKRAALEQFVGNETFNQFEQELAKRESEENNAIQNDDYNKTVQNVENYTKNLNTSDTKSAECNNSNSELLAADTNNTKKEEEIIEQQPQKEKKAKKDPHDLKGLIFIHDKQPDPSNYQDTTAQSVQENTSSDNSKQSKKQKKNKKENKTSEHKSLTQPAQVQQTQPKPQREKFNGVELLPLDTIKAPDLKPNGYSIFAE